MPDEPSASWSRDAVFSPIPRLWSEERASPLRPYWYSWSDVVAGGLTSAVDEATALSRSPQ